MKTTALLVSSALVVPSGLPSRFQVVICRRRRAVSSDRLCDAPVTVSVKKRAADAANMYSEMVQFISILRNVQRLRRSDSARRSPSQM